MSSSYVDHPSPAQRTTAPTNVAASIAQANGLTDAEAALINGVLTQLQAQTGHDLRHYRAELLTSVPLGLDFWQALATQLMPPAARVEEPIAPPPPPITQLSEQQHLLETILYNIPAAVYMLTTDHRYLLVNRVYEQENNITNAAIRGKSIYDRWPAEYADLLAANERQVLAAKAPFQTEEVVMRGDDLRYYATIKAPLLDAAGEPYAIIGISTDISARKAAEAALQRQEELLRLITDNVPGLIAYVGADERYHFVNTAFETWFQRPRQAVIGQTIRDVIGEKGWEQLRVYREQVLAGQAVSYETDFAYPDGVTRTVWGRYQPHFAADGAVLGYYLIVLDISERKQAEEQIRASEARFRQLAEAMPQIVWATDAAGALTYINAQWQHYSGMSLARTLAEGRWPALHPDEREANQAQWQQAVATGNPYEAELRLRRTDGEYRWHLERAVPVYNPAGAIDQWFGAAVDIDDHKRVQEALTKANERFALAEYASNGWVYDFDVQRSMVERSSGFSRILGYPPEEIRADIRWWYNLFHPDDRYLTEGPSIQTRHDAEFAEVEYRIRHRAGHYIHLLDRSRNIHNAMGQRIRVVGITVDISERKRAELHQQFLSQLGLQLRLLSDTDAIMAHLVRNIGQHLGVSGCRVNGIDLAQQLFTVQKDWAAAGDLASGVYPLTELAPPVLLQALQRGQTVVVANTATDPRTAPTVELYRAPQITALIGVPIFRQGHWVATLSVREQGERHWRQDEITFIETVATQFQPLLEKVRVEQALRTSEEQLRQLSEQLEQRVQERTAQLEHSNRELDQFAYVASHDLKAPLRGIEHLANWLMEDAYAMLPEKSRIHLTTLRERVQRMERLLNDLLAYSRVGRRDGLTEVVDTTALVNDIVALLAPPPGFTIHIVGELPALLTPKTPIEIVLRNLIGNALKHHHAPEVGAVWISARAVDDFVEFCVRDNGPGIDPQYHERIFGIFQTLQPRDQVEGSGIGLALVKKAVEYRGGAIRLESDGKSGVAFYFTWPKLIEDYA